MYNYIFYFFYTIYKRRKDGGERFSGVVFTWAAQLAHILFLLAIIRYGFHTDIIPKNNFTNFIFRDRFYMQFTIALPWIVALYFYYNQKRIDEIEQKYSNTKIISLKNGLMVASLLLIPFIIAIRIAIITTK